MSPTLCSGAPAVEQAAQVGVKSDARSSEKRGGFDVGIGPTKPGFVDVPPGIGSPPYETFPDAVQVPPGAYQ